MGVLRSKTGVVIMGLNVSLPHESGRHLYSDSRLPPCLSHPPSYSFFPRSLSSVFCSLKDMPFPAPLCHLHPHPSPKWKKTNIQINLLKEASRAGNHVGIWSQRAPSRGSLGLSLNPVPSFLECHYHTVCSIFLKTLSYLATTGCWFACWWPRTMNQMFFTDS